MKERKLTDHHAIYACKHKRLCVFRRPKRSVLCFDMYRKQSAWNMWLQRTV